MKVGDVVRESEVDPEWILYPGCLGIIISDANRSMGMSDSDHVYYWLVAFGCYELSIMNHLDIEVVYEAG